jgi:hypothetical protein
MPIADHHLGSRGVDPPQAAGIPALCWSTVVLQHSIGLELPKQQMDPWLPQLKAT